MSKIQITDINLEHSELFNDLKDSEIDQIVGGLSFTKIDQMVSNLNLSEESLNQDSISMKLEVSGNAHVISNVHIIKEPICYYPIKPICWYPKPIHVQKPIFPIKHFDFSCPVAL
ncbi:MAG: hypothetical protein AAF915_04470 [Cyanobacteria bacterium P01_D01_bin.50]